MRVTVQVHALLTVAVDSPDGRIDVTVPEGTSIQALVETLSERSSFFDPRSCMAVMEGTPVPMERILRDGEQVHLYPLFGGG
jgi:sulfur carrier protein ThiS